MFRPSMQPASLKSSPPKRTYFKDGSCRPESRAGPSRPSALELGLSFRMLAAMEPKTLTLLDAANEAGAYLRSLGARRVWLFGSVAKGRMPDFRTDLDLAVEGLPADRYFEAVGVLLSRLPCSLDLVEMERAPAALRESVLKFGQELVHAN